MKLKDNQNPHKTSLFNEGYMILLGFRKVKGEWKRTGSRQRSGSSKGGKKTGCTECAKRMKEVADLEDKVAEQEHMIADLRAALDSALATFKHMASFQSSK